MFGEGTITIPSIVVAFQEIFREIVHVVCAKEVLQLLDVALCEDSEADLEVGGSIVERRYISPYFRDLLIEEFQCRSG